jgi:hypothetical protein
MYSTWWQITKKHFKVEQSKNRSDRGTGCVVELSRNRIIVEICIIYDRMLSYRPKVKW